MSGTLAAGGCRCGAVRYSIATPVRTYACHCRDCQTSSGSAFALQAPLMEAAFAVTGALREWRVPRPDGAVSTQYYCATCLCRLFNRHSGRPGMVLVRAGTLDDSELLSPMLHVWTARKQPWVVLDDSVPSYRENAPTAAYLPLFASA